MKIDFEQMTEDLRTRIASSETDLRQALPLLTDIPVFVLDADADRIVNTEMSRALADACLAVRHTFHGWGHFMILDHPQECTEKIRELAVL